MKTLLNLISIFVLATALISGCAPKLFKSPEVAGVIVLEGRTTTTGFLIGKSTLSITEKNIVTATLVNSNGDTFNGQSFYWYVIFGDLAPGSYRITVVSDSGSRSDEINLEGSEDHKITIKAGELKYVGILQVKKTKIGLGLGTMSVESASSPFKVVYKSKDEKSAWERLADAYKKTPWGERMKKRAAEL